MNAFALIKYSHPGLTMALHNDPRKLSAVDGCRGAGEPLILLAGLLPVDPLRQGEQLDAGQVY